ncbi:hypothetical protein EIP91_004218 [Steccherinum ochraceum]|uniref:Uncharacterized protein n=1 Tax=Steccherinum ochraceum TaxID=92696 RepID=A0A4R0RHQ3_9APHY|nr:hypothetical protein EIP91_004218 [Steccherinum ochraceum]
MSRSPSRSPNDPTANHSTSKAETEHDSEAKAAAYFTGTIISFICYLLNLTSLGPWRTLYLAINAFAAVPYAKWLLSNAPDALEGPVDWAFYHFVLLSTNVFLDETNLDCLFQSFFFIDPSWTIPLIHWHMPIFTVARRCISVADGITPAPGPDVLQDPVARRFTFAILLQILCIALLIVLAQIPITWLFRAYLYIWRIDIKGTFATVYEFTCTPLKTIFGTKSESHLPTLIPDDDVDDATATV